MFALIVHIFILLIIIKKIFKIIKTWCSKVFSTKVALRLICSRSEPSLSNITLVNPKSWILKINKSRCDIAINISNSYFHLILNNIIVCRKLISCICCSSSHKTKCIPVKWIFHISFHDSLTFLHWIFKTFQS